MKPEFVTHLIGAWLDDKEFMLTEDLVYKSEILDTMLTVPKGFKTDFASVPRLPLIYSTFGDRAHHESVIHDYLYRTLPHVCDRRMADCVFLEAMECRGKGKFMRTSMYLGVRMGGASSWQ